MGSTDATQVIAVARDAITRLAAGQCWQDYRAVGGALAIGRIEAMRTANTNKPEGRAYAVAFSDWLRHTGLDQIEKIDKSTRARLLDLMDHIDGVERWRATLPTNKQLQLNHPRIVWQHWQRAKNLNSAAEHKASPMAKLKKSVASLSEENERLKAAAGGSIFSGQDRPKDIVKVLTATVSSNKLREIYRLLGEELKQCRAELRQNHEKSHAEGGLKSAINSR
jgi:hypothetical protein